MGAKERTVQPRSQSTPLAEDILALLQSQLRGVGMGGGVQGGGGSILSRLFGKDDFSGTPSQDFGMGLTPLQRQAGQAAQQMVAMGGGAFDTSQLLKDLEAIQSRRVATAAGDIREGYSIGGQRVGTPAATGEARLREGLESQFSAQIGELLRQEFASQMQRNLQSIGMLYNIGTSNLEPFFRFAQQGIYPTQTTYEQHPIISGMQALGGMAQGAGQIARYT